LSDASAVGTGASFECGTFIKFYLKIEKATKTIVEARFQTSGCGFLIAAAEVLSEKITGERFAELHGADKNFLRRQIQDELEEFPADRGHCLEICLEAVRAAFADFRSPPNRRMVGRKNFNMHLFRRLRRND
jgi:NifU-like protein